MRHRGRASTFLTGTRLSAFLYIAVTAICGDIAILARNEIAKSLG